MKTREYLAIKRRIDDFELSEQLTRTKLMQGAKAGDVRSLTLLRERYGLRLPMVEDTIKVPLPWKSKNGHNGHHKNGKNGKNGHHWKNGNGNNGDHRN
jgi:hypothetical protein